MDDRTVEREKREKENTERYHKSLERIMLALDWHGDAMTLNPWAGSVGMTLSDWERLADRAEALAPKKRKKK